MDEGLPKGPGGAPTAQGCTVPTASLRRGWKGLADRFLRWCLRPVIGDVNDRLFRIAREGAAARASLDDRLTALERVGAKARLARLEREGRRGPGLDADRPSSPPAGAHSRAAFDGLVFTERFRGSSALIRQRISVLLDAAAPLAGPLLDLGCGRGEALELCRERGLEGRGVEACADLAALAKDKGLSVLCGDLFDFLSEAAPGSYGTVVLCHVIEHLPLPSLPCLFEGLARVLPVGGKVLLQTPNPACLYGLARFWTDPTHVQPLWWETVAFFLEQAGFGEPALHWMEPCPEGARLLRLRQQPGRGPERVDLVEALNYDIDLLNREFLGFQEYALVAGRL